MHNITSDGDITLVTNDETHINISIYTKGSFYAEATDGNVHVGSEDCINTLKSKGTLNLVINDNISIENVTFDAEKVTIRTETEPPLNVIFTNSHFTIENLSFNTSGDLKIDYNDHHYSRDVLGNMNVTFTGDNGVEFTDAA
ncbi:MAG: hypothetical protein LN575_00210 [Rickettsia endosymbiont of Gnoriste bilineata]|nr:hypothetical protein [Rickettsia endosymbiont of Gnoriste bilineata]